jgi:hypothetical protein
VTTPDNDRIADPLDRAAAETESMIAAAVTFRKPSGPEANGECHNCGADLVVGLRWCNAACRDDWEKEQEIERRALQERD